MLATCFEAGILLCLFFDPEDGGDMFRLHGFISQEMVLFITRRFIAVFTRARHWPLS
jgi:hypothetical protein